MLGRKTITAPTPPITPSTSRSRSGHALVAGLENVDHRVQQSLYAAVVARLYGNHRHAQHAAQTVVIEFRAAVLQLVEHVERHDHARVYINQFGS